MRQTWDEDGQTQTVWCRLVEGLAPSVSRRSNSPRRWCRRCRGGACWTACWRLWEDCTQDAVCAGYTRRRYGRSGRRRCRCLCRGVQKINRLEESLRVGRCTTGLSASRSCPMKSQEIATGRPVEVRVPLRTYLACQPSNTWCARQKTQNRKSEEAVQRAVQDELASFHGDTFCYGPEGR